MATCCMSHLCDTVGKAKLYIERKHKWLPGVGMRVGFPTKRHRGILWGVGIPLYVSFGGNWTMILNQNSKLSG